jgi:hypothetical protein
MINKFQAAFTAFMNEKFQEACVSSTKASWGGSGYSVELYDDGSYRVLWDNNIGNLYDSPEIIISVPALGDDDWDKNGDHFFDNAEESMTDWFNVAVEDYSLTQAA